MGPPPTDLVCLVIHNFRVQLPTLLHGPQPGGEKATPAEASLSSSGLRGMVALRSGGASGSPGS